ncbi:hypothetical protein AYJ54_00640 [Bradyrhizobium centrolobii]|uniref:RNA polymerase sigma-70 region 2 domain-containing protein n=1 Tax=Bradyrhizobium centrolobii TaxID=1505087 RepID=A0A176YIE6_9BRAD|nr:sigma-70 family RNA polymerase sigma factor [Bradyrhizobium centrolobii]OAF05446.1 hypothetical protein AYJ54_00640 [Bradyrhizobium centrolobii]
MTEAEQNQLVIEHMDDLVPAIAAEFRGGELEFEDLLAVGRVGLIKAARSFDADKAKFSTWATTKIRSAIMDAVEATRSQSQWFPKEGLGISPQRVSDSIERVFDWDSWGEFGNAAAICEMWSKLDASPEELTCMYEDIQYRQDRFSAAFISLTGAQRKLVRWVYLDNPRKNMADAARELGVSYHQASRLMRKALATMREVFLSMDKNSGGNIANGHLSTTSHEGCAPGVAA